MAKMNSFFQKIALAGAIGSAIVSFTSNSSVSLSQFSEKPNFPQLNRGRPTGRTTTSRRGPCSDLNPSLIALVPVTQQAVNQVPDSTSSQNGLGVTVAEYPVFWFYIPQLPANMGYAEFMVQDENKNNFLDQRVRIQLPGKPGIIGFRLPSTKPLDIGKEYLWSFSIVCNPQRPSENPFVYGWVQRIPLTSSLTQQLEAAKDDRKRLEIYASNGIWHETLTLLAKLRCDNPNDLQLSNEWSKLLQDIGLTEIDREPIAQCYTPDK